MKKVGFGNWDLCVFWLVSKERDVSGGCSGVL